MSEQNPRLKAFVAAAVLAGFLFCVFIVLTKPTPEGSRELALVLLGALSTKSTQIVTYFFGSSAGSKEKTALLKNRLNGGK